MLARGGNALRSLGPEPVLVIYRRDLQKRLSRWLANQHRAQWGGLGDAQRRLESLSWDLLWVPGQNLNFNRIQSRVVTGLLTGHNTLRRHLYLLGLLDSSLCRKCGVGEETSAHISCECKAWAPFSWSQRILGVYAWRPSGTMLRLRGSHDLIWGTKGPS